MRWIGLFAGILLWPSSSLASLAGAAGGAGIDTIPPTIQSARVLYDPANPENTALLEFIFSEPVDWAEAILFSNYIDANTGQMATQGWWYPPNRTEIRFTDYFWGFGSCEQVRVFDVVDTSGNQIVDDGVGNVFTFHLEQLYVKARMRDHMRGHGLPPHFFHLVGDVEPLAWPLPCPVPLLDADGDSTWAQKVFFSLPCSSATSGAVAQSLEYKLAHFCTELEPLPQNRTYTIDLIPGGRDTLDLWWNDDAPDNFTAQDVDIIFRVQAASSDPPFAAGDSLAVGGSEVPLTWDMPPLTRLLDDGVAPDDTAGDGIFATRVTLPTGTFRDLQYRFLHKALADSVFRLECSALPHRITYVDDTIYSTANPLILDVAFNDCFNSTDATVLPEIAADTLFDSIYPNPARSEAAVMFSIAERTRVTVDVVDVRGRLVRHLVDEPYPAGAHRLVWDGRTDRGQNAGSGVYFVRLVAGDRMASRRVVLAR